MYINKIASGCIAEKVKSVLDKLISKEQTGFMSVRHIFENTRLIYDILHITGDLDIPGLLLISDFEKGLLLNFLEIYWACFKLSKFWDKKTLFLI